MTRPREFGRSWSPLTPRADVEFLLGRTHCGTPFAETEADLRRRMTAPAFTEALKSETVEYARLAWERNRATYRAVAC